MQTNKSCFIIAVMIASMAFSNAHAAHCESIDTSGEFEKLSLGDEVYANLISRISLTVKSIDKAARNVCGDVRGKSKCYPAAELYTLSGADACIEAAKENDPLDVGIIFLYDEEAEPESEPTDGH